MMMGLPAPSPAQRPSISPQQPCSSRAVLCGAKTTACQPHNAHAPHHQRAWAPHPPPAHQPHLAHGPQPSSTRCVAVAAAASDGPSEPYGSESSAPAPQTPLQAPQGSPSLHDPAPEGAPHTTNSAALPPDASAPLPAPYLLDLYNEAQRQQPGLNMLAFDPDEDLDNVEEDGGEPAGAGADIAAQGATSALEELRNHIGLDALDDLGDASLEGDDEGLDDLMNYEPLSPTGYRAGFASGAPRRRVKPSDLQLQQQQPTTARPDSHGSQSQVQGSARLGEFDVDGDEGLNDFMNYEPLAAIRTGPNRNVFPSGPPRRRIKPSDLQQQQQQQRPAAARPDAHGSQSQAGPTAELGEFDVDDDGDARWPTWLEPSSGRVDAGPPSRRGTRPSGRQWQPASLGRGGWPARSEPKWPSPFLSDPPADDPSSPAVGVGWELPPPQPPQRSFGARSKQGPGSPGVWGLEQEDWPGLWADDDVATAAGAGATASPDGMAGNGMLERTAASPFDPARPSLMDEFVDDLTDAVVRAREIEDATADGRVPEAGQPRAPQQEGWTINSVMGAVKQRQQQQEQQEQQLPPSAGGYYLDDPGAGASGRMRPGRAAGSSASGRGGDYNLNLEGYYFDDPWLPNAGGAGAASGGDADAWSSTDADDIVGGYIDDWQAKSQKRWLQYATGQTPRKRQSNGGASAANSWREGRSREPFMSAFLEELDATAAAATTAAGAGQGSMPRTAGAAGADGADSFGDDDDGDGDDGFGLELGEPAAGAAWPPPALDASMWVGGGASAGGFSREPAPARPSKAQVLAHEAKLRKAQATASRAKPRAGLATSFLLPPLPPAPALAWPPLPPATALAPQLQPILPPPPTSSAPTAADATSAGSSSSSSTPPSEQQQQQEQPPDWARFPICYNFGCSFKALQGGDILEPVSVPREVMRAQLEVEVLEQEQSKAARDAAPSAAGQDDNSKQRSRAGRQRGAREGAGRRARGGVWIPGAGEEEEEEEEEGVDEGEGIGGGSGLDEASAAELDAQRRQQLLERQLREWEARVESGRVELGQGCLSYALPNGTHVVLVQRLELLAAGIEWLRGGVDQDLMLGIDLEWPAEFVGGGGGSGGGKGGRKGHEKGGAGRGGKAGQLALVQLATVSRVLLVHVAEIRRRMETLADLDSAPGALRLRERELRDTLAGLLADPALRWVGAAWQASDATKLEAALGVAGLPPQVVDVQRAAQAAGFPRCGLKSLAHEVLGATDFNKSKSISLSNWSKASLTIKQIQYAALDALLPLLVLRQLRLYAAMPGLRCSFCKQALFAPPWPQNERRGPRLPAGATGVQQQPAAPAPAMPVACAHCERTFFVPPHQMGRFQRGLGPEAGSVSEPSEAVSNALAAAGGAWSAAWQAHASATAALSRPVGHARRRTLFERPQEVQAQAPAALGRVSGAGAVPAAVLGGEGSGGSATVGGGEAGNGSSGGSSGAAVARKASGKAVPKGNNASRSSKLAAAWSELYSEGAGEGEAVQEDGAAGGGGGGEGAGGAGAAGA